MLLFRKHANKTTPEKAWVTEYSTFPIHVNQPTVLLYTFIAQPYTNLKSVSAFRLAFMNLFSHLIKMRVSYKTANYQAYTYTQFGNLNDL